MASRKAVDILLATEDELDHVVRFSSLLLREDAGQRDPTTNVGWAKTDGYVYFSRLLSDAQNVCFLASVDAEYVGFLVGLSLPASTLRPVIHAYLHSMFVLKDFRNKQIGSKLVAAFVEWAKLKNAHHITVSTYAANVKAQAFYQRIGFAPQSIQLQLTLPADV